MDGWMEGKGMASSHRVPFRRRIMGDVFLSASTLEVHPAQLGNELYTAGGAGRAHEYAVPVLRPARGGRPNSGQF